MRKARFLTGFFFRTLVAIKRHGLKETSRRIDVIKEQSDFWYFLCLELHAEARKAAVDGDLNKLVRVSHQYRNALRRFEEEVERPMANLHK